MGYCGDLEAEIKEIASRRYFCPECKCFGVRIEAGKKSKRAFCEECLTDIQNVTVRDLIKSNNYEND